MPVVTNARELGLVIRERRRTLRLTQEQAAFRAGVSRRWVSLVETGASRSELGLVLRLLRSLGLLVSIEEGDRVRKEEPGTLDLDAVIEGLRGSG